MRRHFERAAPLYFTLFFKKPIQHNIHSRLYPLTMEWCGYLAGQHTETHSAPQKKTNKQTLAHLLIQKGRILVPKITAWNEMDRGGQIIVALIYEKLTIKHI